MLRTTQGIGGSAPNDQGIDGLWRRARAAGLEAADSAVRRAVNNFSPLFCTDTLPYYERKLGLVAAPGEAEADRQAEVVALWPAKASARKADVEEQLQRIDSRFELLAVIDDVKSCSRPGRCLAPNSGSGEPTYGTRHCSPLARPTSRAMWRARLDIGSQRRLTAAERASIKAAKKRLRLMSPSWLGYTVTTTSGFVLGTSLLGITGL
jgi:hypothetical protein